MHVVSNIYILRWLFLKLCIKYILWTYLIFQKWWQVNKRICILVLNKLTQNDWSFVLYKMAAKFADQKWDNMERSHAAITGTPILTELAEKFSINKLKQYNITSNTMQAKIMLQ